MKNFKKLLALLLCLSLVIGCMLALASCNGNGDDDGDGEETVEGLSSEAKAAAKYVNAFVNTATNLNTASITFSNETAREIGDTLLANGTPLYTESDGNAYKNAISGTVLLKATETGFDAMISATMSEFEKENNGVWEKIYEEEQTYYLINNVSYTYYQEMGVWAAIDEYTSEEVAAVIEQVKTFIATYKQTDVYEAAMNLAYELAGAGASVKSGSLVIGDDYKNDIAAILNFLTELEANDNAVTAINEFISIILPDCEYTVESLLSELNSFGSKTVKELYDMIDKEFEAYGHSIQSIFNSIFEIEELAMVLPNEFLELRGANLLRLIETRLGIDPDTTTVDDLLSMFSEGGMNLSIGMIVETVKAQLKNMTVEQLWDGYISEALEEAMDASIDFEDLKLLNNVKINAADYNVTVSLSGDKLSKITVSENIGISGKAILDEEIWIYNGNPSSYYEINPEIDLDSFESEVVDYEENTIIVHVPATCQFSFSTVMTATVEFGKNIDISLPANVSPVENIWSPSYYLEGAYAEVEIYPDETYNEETDEYEFDGFEIWVEGYYDDYGNWVNSECYYFNQFFPYGQNDIISFTAENEDGYTVTVTINLEGNSISIN